MAHTAHASFDCGSPHVAGAVLAALAPEVEDPADGSKVDIVQEGALLRVHVQGVDLSTLRASLASAVRLVDAALRATGVPKPS